LLINSFKVFWCSS